MDRAVALLSANLAGVGIAEHNAAYELREREILGNLRAVDAGFNILDELRGVDMDTIEELNNAMLRIRGKIAEIYDDPSSRGYLNCESGMDNYTSIRNTFAKLRNQQQAGPHRNILGWITQPVANMPEAATVRAYDKPKGEPTFSKMVLNFAVMLISSRLEWAEGYLTHLQEVAPD